MDDPSFLAGRSSYAKKRRAKRMNVCKCGAIMHNNPDCRKKAISGHKIDRLEFVKRGRVTLSGETPVYRTWVRWVECEYGIVVIPSDESDGE
ncbi:nucleic acid binding protein [Grapevine virus K]|uniref:nucleic acid binding protein n=1 Tax=Grapevine virus K TaxID=2016034 RepID=UPI000B5C0758|nr:nucleic acid binding protein [Grapevine virus K]ASJ27583.1 nucleic acid binding protein [Grapevine virus K]